MKVNKITAILICFAMMFLSFADIIPVRAVTLEGKGTELNPFIACDEATLKMIHDFPDAYWKLSNDIEVTGSWSAIGTSADQFSGTLDGNGYKITGLYRSVAAYTFPRSVFMDRNYGTIKNLHLEGNLTIATPSGGGILAEYNYGTIENCSVSGKITIVQKDWTSNDFGGMVYDNCADGVIKNCYAKVDFVKTNAVASYADVHIGGMVYENGGTIINSYAVGTRQMPSGLTSKKGSGFAYTGSGTAESCYYDKEVSGCSDTKFASGKSTTAMKMEYNYTGWDFENIWAIDENINDGYPYLQNERSVVVAVKDFTLEEKAVTISEGDTVTLTPVFTPQNATDKTVEWTTSSRYVATVDNGVVTGISEGTAIITAVASGIEAKCTVTVTAEQIEPQYPGGECGDNLTWSLIDGKLTISGTGTMEYEGWEAPWSDYAEKITEIEIQDGVTSLSEGAFSYTNITQIYIPKSVAEIGTDAMGCCTNLENITVSSDNPAYLSDDGVLFDKDKKTLLQYPAGKTNSVYYVPDGVNKIAYSAIYMNDMLKNIYIPDSVTEIEYYAIATFGDLTLHGTGGGAAEKYVENFNKTAIITIKFEPVSEILWDYTVNCVNGDVTESGKFRATVSFTKNSDTDNGVVILALYSKDGILSDYIFFEGDFEKGKTYTCGGTLTGFDGAYLKGFVWDSFETMRAISNTMEKY